MPTEPLPTGLVRIAGELLHHAAAGLADPDAPPAEAVHEARKAFKRTRSLLRLGREALGEARFARENVAVRDLGRSLAGFRDADALLEAFDAEDDKGRFPEELAADCVRERLARRRDEHARRQSAELAAARRRALVVLKGVQSRLGQWQPPEDCAQPFAKGLRKAFERAAEAMRAADRERTPAAFHEWRKQVKHCWYMAELLASVWPQLKAAPAISDLDRLASWLGEDHDLVLLGDFVRLEPKPWPEGFDADAFLTALAARRRKLEKRSLALGAEVFAGRPRRVRRTLAAAWQPSEGAARGAAAPWLLPISGR